MLSEGKTPVPPKVRLCTPSVAIVLGTTWGEMCLSDQKMDSIKILICHRQVPQEIIFNPRGCKEFPLLRSKLRVKKQGSRKSLKFYIGS